MEPIEEIVGDVTILGRGTSLNLEVSILNIPVKVYSIQRGTKITFHNIHRGCDGEPGMVGYRLYCKKCGKELGRDEVGKGFRVGKQIIPLSDEEVEGIRGLVSGFRMIGVCRFRYDHCLVDKTYLLLPDEKRSGGKAYRLLNECLSSLRANLVGIYSTHDSEHVAVVRPYGDKLLMDALYFSDEVLDLTRVHVAEAEVSERERELMMQLLEKLQTRFEYSEHHSSLKRRLEEIVSAKMRGEEVKIPKEREAEKEELIKQLEKALSLV